MSLHLSFLVVLTFICVVKSLFESSRENFIASFNKSNAFSLKTRTKRFLVFNGNGVSKLVFGFSQPLDLSDKYPYQQLAVSYSFHFQYNPPTAPVYWWTYFVNNTAWSHVRGHHRQRSSKQYFYLHSSNLGSEEKSAFNSSRNMCSRATSKTQRYHQSNSASDKSLTSLYNAMDGIYKSKELPGKICILRTICEVSKRPLLEINAIHAILNVLFCPAKSNADTMFYFARELGRKGRQCQNIYWICNEGVKWLQTSSDLI